MKTRRTSKWIRKKKAWPWISRNSNNNSSEQSRHRLEAVWLIGRTSRARLATCLPCYSCTMTGRSATTRLSRTCCSWRTVLYNFPCLSTSRISSYSWCRAATSISSNASRGYPGKMSVLCRNTSNSDYFIVHILPLTSCISPLWIIPSFSFLDYSINYNNG